MKHLLIALYIFSILYCYVQLSNLLDRCIDEFKSRHPLIPMEEATWTSSLKVEAEIIVISAIPIFNLLLGFHVSNMGENIISEIISNVESNNWAEIQEAEEYKKEKNELDKYF